MLAVETMLVVIAYDRYFHVCDGSLVPDIMHDVLEGVLEYEAKLLLNIFIKKEKYFTLAEFNSRLQCLDLGYMESKDRPTLIADSTLSSSSNKLKQEGKVYQCHEPKTYRFRVVSI